MRRVFRPLVRFSRFGWGGVGLPNGARPVIGAVSAPSRWAGRSEWPPRWDWRKRVFHSSARQLTTRRRARP